MFRNSLESLPRRYDTLNKNRINEVFDVLELLILSLTLLALLIVGSLAIIRGHL
jgi:hypothetical protein